MKILMNKNDIDRSIKRIAYEIVEKNQGTRDLIIVGIKNGGIEIAKKLKAYLKEIEGDYINTYDINISAFRDDNKKTPDENEKLSFDVNNKLVVLVDDVLFTGRTIRAALDCIFDSGRPKKIELAVLVDRGHRQIPIRADFVGKNIPTSTKETVVVKINDDDSYVEIK